MPGSHDPSSSRGGDDSARRDRTGQVLRDSSPCPATPGPVRAEVAILRVTATTFRDVFYTETRRGRERSLRCSPEVFQSLVGREGAEIAAGQVPAGIKIPS